MFRHVRSRGDSDAGRLRLLPHYQAIGPILIIMFVVRGISMALVKEESDGAFDLALSIPASRRRVIAGKALGVVFSTGLVVVIITIAALAGNIAWETELGVDSILAAGAGLGLLGLFFGGLTMAIWAMGGPRFLRSASPRCWQWPPSC